MFNFPSIYGICLKRTPKVALAVTTKAPTVNIHNINSIIKHNLSARNENCTLPFPVIKTPLCISLLCVLQLQH